MTLGDNQHPVQAFAPSTPHPALGVGVRPRCHQGSQDHSGALALEDGIKASGELSISVVNDDPNVDAFVAQLPAQIASRWVTQAEFGSAVQAAATTRRVARCTKKSTYRRLKNTVSTVKKSVATKLSACALRNWRQLICDLRPAASGLRGRLIGHVEPEVCAGRPNRHQLECSAMRPRNRRAQSQSKAGTASIRGSGAVCPGKSSEQLRAMFWSHARTVIGDFHVPASVRSVTPQQDRGSLGGVPEGVFDQVLQRRALPRPQAKPEPSRPRQLEPRRQSMPQRRLARQTSVIQMPPAPQSTTSSRATSKTCTRLSRH